MMCPHCGNELNTTTFFNPMIHVQGCQPVWQGTFIPNIAATNPMPMLSPNLVLNINNACAAANPASTVIKLEL